MTLLVGLLALCANRVHNGDLYLELGAGRFISQHGLVTHDPFPTIAAGREWLNQQWLSELAFYKVAGLVGMTGLTLRYALGLGLPLSWLLWRCRDKGLGMLALGAALYFPTILAIVHPRAAVFTLAAFSGLLVLLLEGWPGGRVAGIRGRRRLLLAVTIPGLFALWANLHGGFVGGLALLGLVGLGTLLDHPRRARAGWRPGAWRPGARPLLALGAIGLAAVGATFATPLGPQVWTYVWSFRNPALSVATQEWAPAIHSPLIMLYVAVAAITTGWLWRATPRPRPLTPLVVAVGFLALTVYSQRNVVLLGPVMVYLIAQCAPERALAAPRRGAVAVVGVAAVAAGAVWAFALGPARTAPYLKPRLMDVVLRHPPAGGRIASVAGVSSYLLWRSSHTPVVVDGWLEHFRPDELRGAYGVLHATPAGLRYIQRWGIRGVITRSPLTVRRLRSDGFRVVAATSEGTYLSR